ncbi:enoyl-CoA hydratase-related protein [Variovorax sp. NFACC27]|uniref:enoyl-CoA hydratase-related protein n=1 Tax=unclassified Variovorax TaxID=663243 RepID=UPI0008994EC7|nr:2-(1,2-epoxy-1,2-dihydrophenyl)acetyl-CoA isomerase [Variovorax sp. NFACC28]SEG93683.1 2-(1,2-epoxy-1,2-dihydrophenyl)acetyl-CoA isomerase [Variovorax sp. NFACC29]SFD60412.1 2-(1,2-epoxy-1,2-dihydrophenyl)acetyl-CoA isomerase [Variovorax sp. NFACC26]SFG89929.1 2-(1,2-epoxy-1,2-dihydrophenyl)acetyl-CoA isomerase [Variovorax sp. NFACC27]
MGSGTDEDPLLCERDGDVEILSFNIPKRLNPLTEVLQQALRARLAQLREEAEAGTVRALVLTGVGKSFCVGADLSSMGPAGGSDGSGGSLGQRTASAMEALSNRLIEDLRGMPFPVVNAVNGPAAGAGVGVALAADVVIAARSAYFYLPFMPRLGIVPDLGTTWFLERLVGRARAVGMSLLGERLPAEQAAQWGLVWACVDDAELRAQAVSVARRLASLPAHAAREIRAVYESAASQPLVAQMSHEAARQRELLDRPEFAEGVKAFMEKREPVFRRNAAGAGPRSP